MSPSESKLRQETLDLLILNLALKEVHGMGIARHIVQITNGTFEVQA